MSENDDVPTISVVAESPEGRKSKHTVTNNLKSCLKTEKRSVIVAGLPTPAKKKINPLQLDEADRNRERK